MAAVLAAVLTGLIVGVLFTILRLPIPAPPVLSGVAGIVGIWLGGLAGQSLLTLWKAA